MPKPLFHPPRHNTYGATGGYSGLGNASQYRDSFRYLRCYLHLILLQHAELLEQQALENVVKY